MENIILVIKKFFIKLTMSYNRRTWLNPKKSSSTGSVVAFDGKVTDLDTGVKYKERFLKIYDCKSSATLHITTDDTDEDFLNKMKLLRKEIDLFITYLENNV